MDVVMETARVSHGFSEEKRWSYEWMLSWMDSQRASEYEIDLCPLKLLPRPEPPFWSLYMAPSLYSWRSMRLMSPKPSSVCYRDV